MLVLSSCDAARGASPGPPRWFTPREGGPAVLWRCYSGLDRLGVSLWRKTVGIPIRSPAPPPIPSHPYRRPFAAPPSPPSQLHPHPPSPDCSIRIGVWQAALLQPLLTLLPSLAGRPAATATHPVTIFGRPPYCNRYSPCYYIWQATLLQAMLTLLPSLAGHFAASDAHPVTIFGRPPCCKRCSPCYHIWQAALLQAMLTLLPSKEIYIKMDSDAMVSAW